MSTQWVRKPLWEIRQEMYEDHPELRISDESVARLTEKERSSGLRTYRGIHFPGSDKRVTI